MISFQLAPPDFLIMNSPSWHLLELTPRSGIHVYIDVEVTGVVTNAKAGAWYWYWNSSTAFDLRPYKTYSITANTTVEFNVPASDVALVAVGFFCGDCTSSNYLVVKEWYVDWDET